NRFYLLTLTSNKDESITLAIDVEDMVAVAYQPAGSHESYFFLNAPQLAFHTLFTDTHQNVLNFDNTFKSLENAAGTTRQTIVLGVDPLDFAISNLFNADPKLLPLSFLVIIQMVLEASKFRFIEQSVAYSFKNEKTFIPDLAIVSLEDNWSEISLQIQASTSLQGLFGSVVELYNSNNELIEVDSIYYPIILANVALQLYHCQVST
uniref:LECTIN n=1 Tax=Trichosanthes anguina TaxID=50544 RepID=UPI0003847962|nr:Chain B, LECTIN [Trichosanthes anguina]